MVNTDDCADHFGYAEAYIIEARPELPEIFLEPPRKPKHHVQRSMGHKKARTEDKRCAIMQNVKLKKS